MAMTKLPEMFSGATFPQAGSAIYRVYRIDAPSRRARCLTGKLQENRAQCPLV